MNLTPEPPDNVVAINQDVAAELEIQLLRDQSQPCCGVHKSINVFAKSRTVVCRACEQTIDPFEYLAQWGKEGDRRMVARKDMDHKIRVMSAEVESLKAHVGNLRGKLKRAGEPQPWAERQQFSTARLNPGKSFPQIVI